jgi:hypothetical protein
VGDAGPARKVRLREFIDLARTDERSPEAERRLDVLKREMADRLLARTASEVYDVS